MNLFNCYQAVGFYTMLPFAIQWLFANNYNTWGYILAAVLFIGFCMLGIAVNIASEKM